MCKEEDGRGWKGRRRGEGYACRIRTKPLGCVSTNELQIQ